MRLRLWHIGFLCTLSWAASGQIAPEKLRAIKEESRWIKAGQSIRKALGKDSLDPEPAYLMALYFFQPAQRNFNIDTASRYQLLSARLFRQVTSGKRDVPDSVMLKRLRQSIDSAAFQRARRAGTEEAYQDFITRFATASQVAAATELRNEQVFAKAAKVNTAASYRAYLERLPRSARAAEAKTRMERLEFEETTRGKRLADYRKFYKEYPSNPYRPAAERRIFELMTAPGTPGALLRFISAYPDSRWAGRARAVLFYQQRDGENVPDGKWKTDSLRKEREPAGYWVPVYKSGKYGFINEQGKEVISPRFEDIPEGYRCGEIADPFVVTSRGLLARNGHLVWKGRVKDFDDLGLGFLFIATDSGGVVIHSSGYRLHAKTVDDALVIANRLVAVHQNDRWSVLSLTGLPLLPNAFDDIEVLDSVVQFTRSKKRILTTPSRVAAVAEGKSLQEDFVFDEVRKWGDQHYWVRNGVLEGVIDANLKFIIPLDRQGLRKTEFGFVTTKGGNQYVKGIRVLEGKPFKQVASQGAWVRFKDAAGRHGVCDRSGGKVIEGDSAWFRGNLAFLLREDSLHVLLPGSQEIVVDRTSPFRFREGQDSSAYMIVQEKKSQAVYDAISGARLFVSDFDDLEPTAASLFLITRQGRKGLLRSDGKVALPADYDAVVPAGETSFSLLKDKKFGWYDGRSGLLVKPVYDRNVKSYHAKLWLAYRDGGYGFLHPDGKPPLTYPWEEVAHWSDSVAWVKKGGVWKLLDIGTHKVKLDNIRQFQYIRETGPEKLAVVQQDKSFGVLSNRKGVVIPVQYTDVVNLGTRETPLYFTERHIVEAGLTVVVYFDRNGKAVRSQAMEADELDKITCEN